MFLSNCRREKDIVNGQCIWFLVKWSALEYHDIELAADDEQQGKAHHTIANSSIGGRAKASLQAWICRSKRRAFIANIIIVESKRELNQSEISLSQLTKCQNRARSTYIRCQKIGKRWNRAKTRGIRDKAPRTILWYLHSWGLKVPLLYQQFKLHELAQWVPKILRNDHSEQMVRCIYHILYYCQFRPACFQRVQHELRCKVYLNLEWVSGLGGLGL